MEYQYQERHFFCATHSKWNQATQTNNDDDELYAFKFIINSV